jgi:hypothetical protein
VNGAERHEFVGYKNLAAHVVRSALAGKPAEAREFLESERGQLWLSWLRLEPDRIRRQLKRGRTRDADAADAVPARVPPKSRRKDFVKATIANACASESCDQPTDSTSVDAEIS